MAAPVGPVFGIRRPYLIDEYPPGGGPSCARHAFSASSVVVDSNVSPLRLESNLSPRLLLGVPARARDARPPAIARDVDAKPRESSIRTCAMGKSATERIPGTPLVVTSVIARATGRRR